jgi:hypothetical protein
MEIIWFFKLSEDAPVQFDLHISLSNYLAPMQPLGPVQGQPRPKGER